MGKRLPILAAFVIGSLFALVRNPAPAAPVVPHSSDAVFRALVLHRIQAYGRGDVNAYLSMLAEGFIHISDRGERRTAPQMRAYVGNHGNDRASFDVTGLSWRLEGNLAIVDAEVHEHRADFEGGLRELDIFVGRAGRWLYLRHQETSLLQAPKRAAVEGDHLEDYAGRYRTAAGTIDIITARAGRLFDQSAPSDAATPFVQVGRGAFGFADDPTLAVFLRDRTGKVVQCLWHLPSGQTIVSRRLGPRAG